MPVKARYPWLAESFARAGITASDMNVTGTYAAARDVRYGRRLPDARMLAALHRHKPIALGLAMGTWPDGYVMNALTKLARLGLSLPAAAIAMLPDRVRIPNASDVPQ